ncbi:MAG: hypothetical protein ABIQ84_08165 [Usitatibacter sp.]
MKTRSLWVAVAAASLFLHAAPALAQAQNIDKLKQMKVATTDLNIPPVPQSHTADPPARRTIPSAADHPPAFGTPSRCSSAARARRCR